MPHGLDLVAVTEKHPAGGLHLPGQESRNFLALVGDDQPKIAKVLSGQTGHKHGQGCPPLVGGDQDVERDAQAVTARVSSANSSAALTTSAGSIRWRQSLCPSGQTLL
jgi:hypothetical protein